MQNRVFCKPSYENNNHNHNHNHNHNNKTKASLYLIFARFVTHFSKLIWSYILSWSRLSFYFLHPCKKRNFPSLVDTWILPYFRGLEHKGYIYYFSGCESYLLKRLFFLFVILKPFPWSAKSLRARRKCILTFMIWGISADPSRQTLAFVLSRSVKSPKICLF